MRTYLIILAVLGVILLGCSGGGGKKELSFGEVLVPDLSKLAICNGEDKPSHGQTELVAILLARTEGVNEPECIGRVSESGNEAQIHFMFQHVSGSLHRPGEKEVFLTFYQTSQGWESDRYGLPLDGDTAGQQAANQATAVREQEQAIMQMTAESQQEKAAETAIVVSEISSARATAQAVQQSGQIRVRSIQLDCASIVTTSPLPFCGIWIDFENSSSETVKVDLEAILRLGDGSEVLYQTAYCCDHNIEVPPGGETQGSQFKPKDRTSQAAADSSVLRQNVQVVKARILFDGEEVAGDWFNLN